ncbi:hypothetical protein LXA43DRAFT_1156466 [Ganoderma leucocontextum]|nr:hypothetical protein LXA43DRAFT_1156466 [Ganoderma leucocontextum]
MLEEFYSITSRRTRDYICALPIARRARLSAEDADEPYFEDRRDYRRADSVQMKLELIDGFVSNGLVAPVSDVSPADPYSIPRAPSPITPPRANPPTRVSYSPPRNSFHPPQFQPQPQSSLEDGEIFSPPSPKAPPLTARSHTPLMHPSSFYAERGDISPTRWSLPPSSARPPLHSRQYSQAIPEYKGGEELIPEEIQKRKRIGAAA